MARRVVYSTSYTTGLEPMMREFHISSEPIATLGVTTYLFGLAIGSIVLAPISETYGRKPVYAISMFFFLLMLIPCGLATSMSEIIVVRLFGAIFGSAMIANAPGTVGDIVTAEYRALAFSIWSIGPLNGPGGPASPPVVNWADIYSFRSDHWRLCNRVSGVALGQLAHHDLRRRSFRHDGYHERNVCARIAAKESGSEKASDRRRAVVVSIRPKIAIS